MPVPPKSQESPVLRAADVLNAVFVLAERKKGCPKCGRLEFRAPEYELQKIFRHLGNKFEASPLSVFVYSNSGPEPYSPILGEALTHLIASGFVVNFSGITQIRPAAGKDFEAEGKSKFDNKELLELEIIAEAFLKIVPRPSGSL